MTEPERSLVLNLWLQFKSTSKLHLNLNPSFFGHDHGQSSSHVSASRAKGRLQNLTPS